MITTATFKKQIAKKFGDEMRLHGFKGTGFDYVMDTEEFLIAVYISPSKWGGSCSAMMAIHPKVIDKSWKRKLNVEKLGIYLYEYKLTLATFARGKSWNYADDEATNLVTLAEIITLIKKKVFPVIEQFTRHPTLPEQFHIKEMDNLYKNWTKRTGTCISVFEVNFAWSMALMLEHKKPQKAKQFAKWCIKKNGLDNEFWGNDDLKRIAYGIARKLPDDNKPVRS